VRDVAGSLQQSVERVGRDDGVEKGKGRSSMRKRGMGSWFLVTTRRRRSSLIPSVVPVRFRVLTHRLVLWGFMEARSHVAYAHIFMPAVFLRWVQPSMAYVLPETYACS
jgi:hypothetical protein